MIIKVKAKPKSKLNKIEIKDDVYNIKVTAEAHKNKANEAIIELLSKHFNKPKKSIQIIKGLKEKNKIIEII